jgi:hypothetical protein
MITRISGTLHKYGALLLSFSARFRIRSQSNRAIWPFSGKILQRESQYVDLSVHKESLKEYLAYRLETLQTSMRMPDEARAAAKNPWEFPWPFLGNIWLTRIGTACAPCWPDGFSPRTPIGAYVSQIPRVTRPVRSLRIARIPHVGRAHAHYCANCHSQSAEKRQALIVPSYEIGSH